MGDDFPISDEVLTAATRARERGLCAECFGRCFGRLGHGWSNPERAEKLAAAVGGISFSAPVDCSLCAGGFDRWETWIRRAKESASTYEFTRFTCGCRWPPEQLAREEAIWREIGSTWGESARTAFNREWGKRLEPATSAQGGGDNDADIVFLADIPAGRVTMTVRSLYVTGRYRKFDRTLPQTRWPCRRCQGRGCETCHGSGKTYPTSVEEIVAAPFLAASQGVDSRFHGMGREDIDARMLGTGRPFVLEITQPHRRSVDIAALAAAVNAADVGRVEVQEMVAARGEDVVRVKEASPWKSYRVTVVGEVAQDKLDKALSVVAGRAIAQRTPTRVAHRRADLVRTRTVAEARVVEASEGRFTIELRAEAGTYVKEWVEGDGGRTEPSLSGVLGIPLHVAELDVVAIHDREV
jgi:tRNA pseudouridine synthase 10